MYLLFSMLFYEHVGHKNGQAFVKTALVYIDFSDVTEELIKHLLKSFHFVRQQGLVSNYSNHLYF